MITGSFRGTSGAASEGESPSVSSSVEIEAISPFPVRGTGVSDLSFPVLIVSSTALVGTVSGQFGIDQFVFLLRGVFYPFFSESS